MQQKQELHGIPEEPNGWQMIMMMMILSFFGIVFFDAFFG